MMFMADHILENHRLMTSNTCSMCNAAFMLASSLCRPIIPSFSILYAEKLVMGLGMRSAISCNMNNKISMSDSRVASNERVDSGQGSFPFNKFHDVNTQYQTTSFM